MLMCCLGMNICICRLQFKYLSCCFVLCTVQNGDSELPSFASYWIWKVKFLKLFLQAIVFYELAIHFNPRCAEACNNLGVIYKDRDNLDKAVECYQVEFYDCLEFLLLQWVFSRSSTLSLLALQLALSINPNFSQSLNNLGVVFTVQVCLV